MQNGFAVQKSTLPSHQQRWNNKKNKKLAMENLCTKKNLQGLQHLPVTDAIVFTHCSPSTQTITPSFNLLSMVLLSQLIYLTFWNWISKKLPQNHTLMKNTYFSYFLDTRQLSKLNSSNFRFTFLIWVIIYISSKYRIQAMSHSFNL